MTVYGYARVSTAAQELTLTDDDARNIRIKLLKGVSCKGLAEEYGIALRNIHKIRSMESYFHIVVEGYDPNAFNTRPTISQETKEIIRRMLTQGVRNKDIAEQLGVSLNTVGREKIKMKTGE